MEPASGTAFDSLAAPEHREALDGIAFDSSHAALVLDRLGRILSCGEPAARLLAASQASLIGRWISDFISGMFRVGSSPSYCARYLGHLCADDAWRRFPAVDDNGQPLLVDINLARLASGHSPREIFLLNLRRQD